LRFFPRCIVIFNKVRGECLVWGCTMSVVVRDEKGDPLPEEIVPFLDLETLFDGAFEPMGIPSDAFVGELEISTDASTCRVSVMLGRIVLVSYGGEVKDVELVVERRKIEAIKRLVG